MHRKQDVSTSRKLSMSRRSTRPRTFSRRAGRWTPAGTPRSFDFELLESRTLLAGTPISSVQAGAIVQGLQALVSAGAQRRLPGPGHLGSAPGPGRAGEPARRGDLARFHRHDRIVRKLSQHVPAQTGPGLPGGAGPTVEGLETVFSQAVDGVVSSSVTADLLTFTFQDISFGAGSNLAIDLGGVGAYYDLTTDATQAPADIAAVVTIPLLTLNLQLGPNIFFINTPQVQYQLQDQDDVTGMGVALGFLGTTVDGGIRRLHPRRFRPRPGELLRPAGPGGAHDGRAGRRRPDDLSRVRDARPPGQPAPPGDPGLLPDGLQRAPHDHDRRRQPLRGVPRLLVERRRPHQ